MRKLILFGAALLLSVPSLMAQETQFGWDSRIVVRTAQTSEGNDDTNRTDMTVPLYIGPNDGSGFVIRGVGQIFAPRIFFPIYDPYYNGDNPDLEEREQAYIDQLKGVQSWQLNSIQMNVYHNPDNTPRNPSYINFWRMNTDYSNSNVRDSGMSWSRTALDLNVIEGAAYIMDVDELKETVFDQGGQRFIQRTSITFNPPLEFEKEESVMTMFINEFDPAVQRPFDTIDTRSWQRLIGYMEYESGSFESDGDPPFRNPRPRNNAHGVIMVNQNGIDTILHVYRRLIFNQVVGQDTVRVPLIMNFDVRWFGIAELDATDVPDISSVRYHFGYDATEQGLGQVAPNPVVEEAIIPFSLTKTSNVTLELYTANGEKVGTLVDNKRYAPGKYSVRIAPEELQSGVYLVRMTADENAYSMKFTVTE
ncbi:MAG: T9SS type A sorting domain-containing protein [Chlorobi bacterium]|nr:T9SS type A sorting domain-containing protein [Chlorobiota bacterium]